MNPGERRTETVEETLNPLFDKGIELLDGNFGWLVFLVIVLLFKGPIGKLLDRLTKASFEAPGGLSGVFEANSPNDDGIIAEEEGAEPVEPDAGDTSEEAKAETTHDPSFERVRLAIMDGNIQEARKTFDEFEKTLEESDNHIGWRSMFLQALFLECDDHSALEELKTLSAEVAGIEEKLNASSWLADTYRAIRDKKNELALLQSLLEETENDNNRTTVLLRIANFHKGYDNPEASIALLEGRLSEVNEDSERARLFDALAKNLQNIGRKSDAAVAYEKANECDPGNRGRLFSTAFLQGEQDWRLLSMANYQTLLRMDQSNAAALNNLAIIASELEFEGKKIELYKKSIEAGNTLASANLANAQISAGFWDEANVQLTETLKLADPHENVGESLYKLKSTKEKQGEEWLDLNNRAERLQRRVRTYGDALFDTDFDDSVFSGSWYTARGTKFEIEIENSRFDANWSEVTGAIATKEYEFTLQGTSKNRAATASYNSNPIGDSSPEIGLLSALRSQEESHKNLFSYVTPDGASWHFFSIDPDKDFKLEFTRSKPAKK